MGGGASADEKPASSSPAAAPSPRSAGKAKPVTPSKPTSGSPGFRQNQTMNRTFDDSSNNNDSSNLERKSTITLGRGGGAGHLGRATASSARETALGISSASSATNATSTTNALSARGAGESPEPGGGLSGVGTDASSSHNVLERTSSKANTAFSSAKTRARQIERTQAQQELQQQQLLDAENGGNNPQNRLQRQLSDMTGLSRGSSAVNVFGSSTQADAFGATASSANLFGAMRDGVASGKQAVSNGTPKIKHLVDTMGKFRQQMKKHREVSDADIMEMRRAQEQYAQLKIGMAQQISAIGQVVDVVGRPNRQALYDLLENVMREGEAREGSIALLSTCLSTLRPLDWVESFLVGGKAMIMRAATEGWFQFLDIMLQWPNLIFCTSEDMRNALLERARANSNNKNEDDEDDCLADLDDDIEGFDSVGDFAKLDQETEDSNRLAGGGARAAALIGGGGGGAAASSPTSNNNNQPKASTNANEPPYIDPVILLEKCVHSPDGQRIPLCGTLCKHWSRMHFTEYSAKMQPLWYELMLSLCSPSRVQRGEDRTQRMGMITKMLSLSSCIEIDINAPDTNFDNQSLISRSIIEGDAAVFQTLTRRSADVTWNVVLPDGHSLLTLACASAQRQIVELLVARVPEVDLEYEVPGQGTAIDIVQMSGGNAQIMQLLNAKQAELQAKRDADEQIEESKRQDSHHQQLQKRLKALQKSRTITREQNAPEWVAATAPTGPPGVDVEKDADWLLEKNSKPVIMTGPILDVVHALREHWNLMNVRGGDGAAGGGAHLMDMTMSSMSSTATAFSTGGAGVGAGGGLAVVAASLAEVAANESNQQQQQQQRESAAGGAAADENESSTKLDDEPDVFANVDETAAAATEAAVADASAAVAAANANDSPQSSRRSSRSSSTLTSSSSDAGGDAGGGAAAQAEAKDDNANQQQQQQQQEDDVNQDEGAATAEAAASGAVEASLASSVIDRLGDEEYLLDGPALRQDLAASLLSLGATRIIIEGKEPKAKVYDCVNRLLAEGSAMPGSLKLARLLMYRVISVDFAPSLSGSTKWALKAAKKADLEALETLLRVDKLWREEHEVVELVTACVRHPAERIRLSLILLRNQKLLRFGTYRDHLRPLWEELVESLASPQRFNFQSAPEADKKLRFELICRIFATPNFYQLRHDIELQPGITWFSRACRIGDLDFVSACIDYCVCDINRLYSNKSTPLMQAVVGSQMKVIEMLCACSDVDPFVEGPNGKTALDLAKQLRRDNELVQVIVDASERIATEQEAAQKAQLEQRQQKVEERRAAAAGSTRAGGGAAAQ